MGALFHNHNGSAEPEPSVRKRLHQDTSASQGSAVAATSASPSSASSAVQSVAASALASAPSPTLSVVLGSGGADGASNPGSGEALAVDASRSAEGEALLARPITCAELIRALASPALADADLVLLIRRCVDLCDEANRDVVRRTFLPKPRLTLLPALLGRVVTPLVGCELQAFEEEADMLSGARLLLSAVKGWLARRYTSLAHAEIWHLWPDQNFGGVKTLIAEYFGDG
jgi:hypothetical protein